MLVMIFGPQAVGKMTVGEELAKKTGLTLFHNHMSIEFVLQFHEYKTKEAQGMIRMLRDEVMTSLANSEHKKGMIFTFVWALSEQADWDYVEHVQEIFEDHEQYFIELYSDLETRKKRNVTENRLNKKPSKRNVEWSQAEIVRSMEKHKLSSTDEDFGNRNIIKIDNTELSAKETAELIIKKFNLEVEDEG